MVETGSITLIVILINTVTTPLFQYLLNSKCDIVKCCCGLVDIHRVVSVKKEIEKEDKQKDLELGQL